MITVEQLVPLYPGAQLQTNPVVPWLAQEPPFRHGFEPQAPVSAVKKKE